MAETSKPQRDAAQDARRTSTHSRRKILFLIPLAAAAAVVGPVVAAAFKFLRPRAGDVGVGGAGGGWFAVARLSEIAGEEPLRREVLIEHRAGWSSSTRGHAVYVLPGEERRVVSAVCPHEGCEVEWSGERREFLCPCHDSNFSLEGARAGGPAQSGLARLNTRVNGDVLEMQYADAPSADHEPRPRA